MVHLSAKCYDINPGYDIHESSSNPPENVWRFTCAFNYIICIWIPYLCSEFALRCKLVMSSHALNFADSAVLCLALYLVPLRGCKW